MRSVYCKFFSILFLLFFLSLGSTLGTTISDHFAGLQAELASSAKTVSECQGQVQKLPSIISCLDRLRDRVSTASTAITMTKSLSSEEAMLLGNKTVEIIPTAVDFMNMAAMKTQYLPRWNAKLRSMMLNRVNQAAAEDQALMAEIARKCEYADMESLQSSINNLMDAWAVVQKAFE